MNLFKSVPKNKSSVFNGLQAKLTGSNPVALTTFPHLDSGNNYNDLANNSLKTLPNLKHQSLKRTYSIPNTFLKNRSNIGVFSPQIVCNRLSISWQQFSYKIRVTGQVLKIVFFYL
jgi:hypothetical protein